MPRLGGQVSIITRRGANRLPGVFNIDFSVNKGFHFGEKARFELRTEFYNLFNDALAADDRRDGQRDCQVDQGIGDASRCVARACLLLPFDFLLAG